MADKQYENNIKEIKQNFELMEIYSNTLNEMIKEFDKKEEEDG